MGRPFPRGASTVNLTVTHDKSKFRSSHYNQVVKHMPFLQIYWLALRTSNEQS
ncbi:hypothetical protein CLV24_1481 [Pontibacter ummariensis]|uniref:Uncharacterized protein n=1 Tax=Pontibacter ummariensis TaxID=1610492 RepID=A0A239LS11_9BACT|nr:hypothetical protein CLV24_1481 [Pontibacter ummariensis]SNT32732.1 hypothetical protein SAMN06296052_1481 [Pontibacter ummariensis]